MLASTAYQPTETQLGAFWREEEQRFGRALLPALREVASEQAAVRATAVARATGRDADQTFALINRQVLGWVDDYYINADGDPAKLGSLPNLTLTARTRFAQAFQEWQRGELEVGRPVGLPQLIDALTPAFGAVRAEAIAVTETTRAFSQALLEAERDNEFTIAYRWLSSADELVCPQCGPRAGRVYSKKEIEGVGVPPLHPRCRCQITPETKETLRLSKEQVRQLRGTATAEGADSGPVTVERATPALQYQPNAMAVRLGENAANDNIKRIAAQRNVEPAAVERAVDGAFRKLVAENSVAIQFKSQHIDSLLTDGRFKSQFETKSSGGVINESVRTSAEYFGLGVPVDAAPKNRPIYGYMDLGSSARSKVRPYGDLTFIAKDELKLRATVTAGDSLENMQDQLVVGTPANDPTKAGWDRKVAALYDYATTGNIRTLTRDVRYIEAQIQGDVTLSDMRAVVDAKGVLTGAQRQALKDRGVEVWDK